MTKPNPGLQELIVSQVRRNPAISKDVLHVCIEFYITFKI